MTGSVDINILEIHGFCIQGILKNLFNTKTNLFYSFVIHRLFEPS